MNDMHEQGFEIQYSVKRSEVWNWYWRQWYHGALKWLHLKLMLLVFSIKLYIDYKLDDLGPYTLLTAALICLVIFIFMIGWPQICFKPQQRQLTISKQGITTTIGKHTGNVAWSEIESIENHDKDIVLQGVNKNAFIIPKRAFATTIEAQAFYKAASLFL